MKDLIVDIVGVDISEINFSQDHNMNHCIDAN